VSNADLISFLAAVPSTGSLPMLGDGGWVPLGRCRLKGLPVSSV
jgi:hypothetical protein